MVEARPRVSWNGRQEHMRHKKGTEQIQWNVKTLVAGDQLSVARQSIVPGWTLHVTFI